MSNNYHIKYSKNAFTLQGNWLSIFLRKMLTVYVKVGNFTFPNIPHKWYQVLPIMCSEFRVVTHCCIGTVDSIHFVSLMFPCECILNHISFNFSFMYRVCSGP